MATYCLMASVTPLRSAFTQPSWLLTSCLRDTMCSASLKQATGTAIDLYMCTCFSFQPAGRSVFLCKWNSFNPTTYWAVSTVVVMCHRAFSWMLVSCLQWSRH